MLGIRDVVRWEQVHVPYVVRLELFVFVILVGRTLGIIGDRIVVFQLSSGDKVLIAYSVCKYYDMKLR